MNFYNVERVVTTSIVIEAESISDVYRKLVHSRLEEKPENEEERLTVNFKGVSKTNPLDDGIPF